MIEVKDLSFAYSPASADVLHGISFTVKKGEIFGFLGPSGAGKSTTQRILTRQLDGYRGSASVMNREVASWGQNLYERIGISFELPNHFLKLSARENLRFFGALYQNRSRSAEELLDRVGLLDDADVRIGEYSKGMKNRLTVARALLHDPEILFLDEPTAGLDPVNTARIRGIIEAERDTGKTVFLTTHDMVTADLLCDRVAFMHGGNLASIDSPRTLKILHGKREVEVTHAVTDGIVRLRFPLDGLAENQDFQALLKTGNVQTIHTQEASLAEVFTQVTGKSLV